MTPFPHLRLRPAFGRPAVPPVEQPPHLQPGQSLAVELHVPDVDAAVAWLETWGFEVLARTRAFAALQVGGNVLLVGRRPRSRPAAVDGTVGELRLIVPDAAALRATADDADLVQELHRASYGLIEFVVASPFGIDLRVASPAAWYEEETR